MPANQAEALSTSSLPIRGGLPLRRSDEQLRAELPAVACPATVAISGKSVPNGASGTGPGTVLGAT
jgi:hypothetical protein